MKGLWVIVILVVALAGIPGPGLAQPPAWNHVVGRHAIVAYQHRDELIAFNRQIRYGFQFGVPEGSDEALAALVAGKVDALYERAQQILDMRGKSEKVTIRLHPDSRRLHEIYQALFKAECPYRAWYLYEKKTVYINVADVTAGMVAHEVGHHIIDHYFKVRPPAATAEILARYIDAHLFEKSP